MKLKIPNILTIGRIIIVPIFVITFFLPGMYGDLIPFFLFIAASSVLLTGEVGNKIVNFEDYNAQTIGIILLWVSAFLTLYTGYGYLVKGIDHAIAEDNKN